MQIKTKSTEINRNYEDLAPFFAQKLRLALAECAQKGYSVDLFEGLRSNSRQTYLWESGRTRDGKIITHAKAGQSWHNVALAADIVGRTSNRWDWSIDYDNVEQIMITHGFQSLKFERAHFQMTGGMSIAKASKIASEQGLLALWTIVEQTMK
jgi:hypothetical protein